jgi:phosphate transport system substrate-binding protein
MTVSTRLTAATFGLAAALAGTSAFAAEVTGAGSSFVYPLMSKWSADYNAATGNKINYQSIGSSGGIAQIKASTVDFGASDKPMEPAELTEAGLIQFPVTIGGVVPVINVEGIEPGRLKLTGTLLADIFLGKVTRWNDAAIVGHQRGRLPARHQDHHRASFGWLGQHLQLHQLSFQGQPRSGRRKWVRRHVGKVAGWPWRQGQRRRCRLRQAGEELDRLRRAFLRPAEQDVVHPLQNAAGTFVTPSAETFAAAPRPAPTGPAPAISA